MPNKPTIFSGVQPSGQLHLGNYLGAISNWAKLQDKYNCIFCVVDYHAITTKQDPKTFNQNILDTAKIYIAGGINPKKSIIFQQSSIPEHTELAWILNCIANAGDLKRMTQFRDKTGLISLDQQSKLMAREEAQEFGAKARSSTYKLLAEIYNEGEKNKEKHYKKIGDLIKAGGESMGRYAERIVELENKKFNNSTVGIFDYPVLMAADILLYNTDAVPVGEDQSQHVELARTLAKRFNQVYGEVFKVPELIIRQEGARIMGLDDPTAKMSKSASSSANYIALTDSPQVASKKIMRATTDSGSDIKYDLKKKPGISNLLTIYSLLTDKSIKQLENKYKNKGYGDFKKDLAKVVSKFLISFQMVYNKLESKEIRKILDKGAKKLRPIAQDTIKKVKIKIGI